MKTYKLIVIAVVSVFMFLAGSTPGLSETGNILSESSEYRETGPVIDRSAEIIHYFGQPFVLEITYFRDKIRTRQFNVAPSGKEGGFCPAYFRESWYNIQDEDSMIMELSPFSKQDKSIITVNAWWDNEFPRAKKIRQLVFRNMTQEEKMYLSGELKKLMDELHKTG